MLTPPLPQLRDYPLRDQSQVASQRNAIRALCDRIADAWSTSDPASAATGWTVDGDHVTLTRVPRVRRGRAALEMAWREAFAQHRHGGRKMKFALTSIRFLKPDVAIVDGSIAYTSPTGAEQREEPALTEAFTAVMTRHDSEWLIAASRTGPALPSRKVIPITGD